MSEKLFLKIERENPNPDAKTYRIETVQDMIDAVNDENIDKFLVEFGMVLRSAMLVKSVNDSVNDKNGTSDKIEVSHFDWTDD